MAIGTETPQRPFVLGVTGGIGSGKTAATDHFQALGIAVVDADLAARAIMEPGGAALAAVAERFGDDILLADGHLDRAALRRIVFEEPEQRQWLEQLTHPLIGEEVAKRIGEARSDYAVLASPLLLEGSQRSLCDRVLVIDAPESLQIQRTTARDGNTEEQVRRIMAAQMGRKERLALADHVIVNDGSLENLHRQVEAVHTEILATLKSP